MKTKYQIFEYSITSGSAADVTIDENIDRKYKKVTDIFMQTNSVIGSNLNLEVADPIRINDQEVYPRYFDTFMLYPIVQNSQFTKLAEPIVISNSKIEGRLKTVASVGTSCTLRIILKLEE